MTSTTVRKRMIQDVQRQPTVCVAAAPRRGPKAGLQSSVLISLLRGCCSRTYPKNGAATYMDIGPDRLSGGHKSLSVPDPILKLGAAKNPAKKRVTTRVAMFCANPVPSMNNANIGKLMNTTGFRPKLSDSGAAKGPPKASPSW